MSMDDDEKDRLKELEQYVHKQENFNGRLSAELTGMTSLLQEIKEDVSDTKEVTQRVEIQANKTNGRVTQSEKDIGKLEGMVTEQSNEIKGLREDKIKTKSTAKALFFVASITSVVIGLFIQAFGLGLHYYINLLQP